VFWPAIDSLKAELALPENPNSQSAIAARMIVASDSSLGKDVIVVSEVREADGLNACQLSW